MDAEYSDCCCNQISSDEDESLELRGKGIEIIKTGLNHFGWFLGGEESYSQKGNEKGKIDCDYLWRIPQARAIPS